MLTTLAVTRTIAKVYSVDVYGHSTHDPHPYYPKDSNLFACVDKPIFARFIFQATTKDVMASVKPYIIKQFCDAVTQVSGANSKVQSPRWAGPRDMAEWSKSRVQHTFHPR